MFASADPSLRRRRAASMLLVIAIHVAVFLLLWTIAPERMKLLDPQRGALKVTLLPNAEKEAPTPTEAKDEAEPAPAERQVEQARAQPTPPTPVPPLPKPAAPEDWSFKLIPGMEKFDLAQLPQAARPPGKGASAGAGASASADIGGAIPGRERLFPAQWQRKPSRAELSGYLPPGLRQNGFGMIACRTVPDFRVEDCEELDQSPGSGLAGAVRQAAWQFRVRPPRVGGRTLVGAWVRIRIDYKEGVPE